MLISKAMTCTLNPSTAGCSAGSFSDGAGGTCTFTNYKSTTSGTTATLSADFNCTNYYDSTTGIIFNGPVSASMKQNMAAAGMIVTDDEGEETVDVSKASTCDTTGVGGTGATCVESSTPCTEANAKFVYSTTVGSSDFTVKGKICDTEYTNVYGASSTGTDTMCQSGTTSTMTVNINATVNGSSINESYTAQCTTTL